MRRRYWFLWVAICSILFACNGNKSQKAKYMQFVQNNFDTAATYCFNDGNMEVVFFFSQIDEDTCVLNYFNFNNQALAVPKVYLFNQIHKLVPDFFKEMFDNWDGEMARQSSVFGIANNSGKIKIYQTIHDFVFNVQENRRFKEKIFDSVSVKQDIQYGEAKGFWKSLKYQGKEELNVILEKLQLVFSSKSLLKLNLDIYEPHEDQSPLRPLIVYFHDGAFWAGDKADATAIGLGHYFAKHGYVFASADYRLGFATIPSIFKLPNQLDRSGYQAIQDGRAVLRYLVHHAMDYRIDTSKIFLAGASAGSILALNVAFMDDDEKPESAGDNFWIGGDNYLFPDLGCLDCSTNSLTDSFNIKGLINMWGAVSDTSIIDEYIPVLSFHGDKDQIVPFGHEYPYNKFKVGINRYFSSLVFGSDFINKQLDKLKIPNRLVIFEDFLHSPHLDDDNNFNANYDTILDYSRGFYYDLIKENIKIAGNKFLRSSDDLQVYQILPRLNNAIAWEAQGGRVLGVTEDKSKVWVQWFKGVTHRKLKVKLANPYNIISQDSIDVELDGEI